MQLDDTEQNEEGSDVRREIKPGQSVLRCAQQRQISADEVSREQDVFFINAAN